MAKPAHRRATYDDLCAVAPNLVAEIIDGELFTSPRPAYRHSLASSGLGAFLTGPFGFGLGGGPGGWHILDEPELHFGADVLVPDLAGWRRERMPEVPDVAFHTLAPDWVCEVLSPSTARLDRANKLPVYAREGATHLWLIDPIVKTLEVLRREGPLWLLLETFAGDAKVRAAPFDAIELDLSLLWLK